MTPSLYQNLDGLSMASLVPSFLVSITLVMRLKPIWLYS